MPAGYRPACVEDAWKGIGGWPLLCLYRQEEEQAARVSFE